MEEKRKAKRKVEAEAPNPNPSPKLQASELATTQLVPESNSLLHSNHRPGQSKLNRMHRA